MHTLIENFLTSLRPAPTTVEPTTEPSTDVTNPEVEGRFTPNRAQRRAGVKAQAKFRLPGTKKPRLGGFGTTLRGYFDQKRLVAKLEKQAAAARTATEQLATA